MPCSEFSPSDKLFRGFKTSELDEHGELDADTLRLPDLSCNWDRFSLPDDIRYRMPGCDADGCYSITVATVRYNSFANVVHDPICGKAPNRVENYAHVEVRELRDEEGFDTVPPKGRKKRSGKAHKLLRFKWRTNIVNNLVREFEPMS